jgi:hypothetical protein
MIPTIPGTGQRLIFRRIRESWGHTRIPGTGHPPQTGVSMITAVRKVVFPMCPYVDVSIRRNRFSRSRSRIKGYVPEVMSVPMECSDLSELWICAVPVAQGK